MQVLWWVLATLLVGDFFCAAIVLRAYRRLQQRCRNLAVGRGRGPADETDVPF